MQPQKISFAKPVKILKDQFSKLWMTNILGPIFFNYICFEECLDEAFNNFEYNEGLTENNLPKIIEAISYFDINTLKELINEIPIEVSNSLLNEEKHYIEINYPEFTEICHQFKITELQVQTARNALFSYIRIFQNDLVELDKAARSLNNLFNASNDTAASFRQGFIGGTVGMAIGSVIFPGVGTFIGSLVGGYLMSQNRKDKILQQIDELIKNYIYYSRSLVNKLVENSKELYMVLGRIYEDTIIKKDRRIYFEMKKIDKDVDKIFIDYYQNEIQDFENSFQTCRVDNENPESITLKEFSEFVYNFINQEEKN